MRLSALRKENLRELFDTFYVQVKRRRYSCERDSVFT